MNNDKALRLIATYLLITIIVVVPLVLMVSLAVVPLMLLYMLAEAYTPNPEFIVATATASALWIITVIYVREQRTSTLAESVFNERT